MPIKASSAIFGGASGGGGGAETFAAYLGACRGGGGGGNDDKDALESLVWPEALRPNAAPVGSVSIPEVDLGGLLRGGGGVAARRSAAAATAAAAAELGFFRIINTGVAAGVMARAEQAARRFFALPLPRKTAASASSGSGGGKTGGGGSAFGYAAAGPNRTAMRSWHEMLYIRCRAADIAELAARSWPAATGAAGAAEAAALTAALSEYSDAMARVAGVVLQLLFVGLGVAEEEAARLVRANFGGAAATSAARINLYPPCPKPDLTFGLPPHTDSGTLTILHAADGVPGLQVLSSSRRWVNVPPGPPATFIVNIGDCLQAWSNNRYRSVEHRVLVNSSKPRLSLAFFYNPRDSTVIDSALTGTPVYRDFTWADYRAFAPAHKDANSNNGASKTALAHFRR